MHELSIAMSIVEAASDEAHRLGDPRVEAVHLKLGALCGVVKDALLFAWQLACEDSPIAGCRLEIEDTAGAELDLTALEIEDVQRS